MIYNSPNAFVVLSPPDGHLPVYTILSMPDPNPKDALNAILSKQKLIPSPIYRIQFLVNQ